MREGLLHEVEAGPPLASFGESRSAQSSLPHPPYLCETHDDSCAAVEITIGGCLCAPLRQHALQTPSSSVVAGRFPRSDTEQTSKMGETTPKERKTGVGKERERDTKK